MSHVFSGVSLIFVGTCVSIMTLMLLIAFIIKYVSFRKFKSVSCLSVVFAILATLFYIIAAIIGALVGWMVLLDRIDKLSDSYVSLSLGFWHCGQLCWQCIQMIQIHT